VQEELVGLWDIDGCNIADAQPHDFDRVEVSRRLVDAFPAVDERNRVGPLKSLGNYRVIFLPCS
jgi:hypothetical protein